MLWLTVGIIPPILWAIVNHADKYLLSKSKHHSSVDVLMVYSTLFSLIVLPFLYYFFNTGLFGSWIQVGVQIAGGVLMTLSIYFYLVALTKDEASVVMPFALLTPLFGYVFAYFLLGESLSIREIIACGFIIFGAVILSLEFEEERKIKLKHGVFLFMGFSTAFQAAQETLFKFVTVDNSVSASFFWLHVGIAICGFILLATKRKLSGHFLDSLRINGRIMFGVNVISEAMSAMAYMVRNYALLLAPVVIIMTLNAYQPVFVFIIGILLTLFLPKISTEKIRTMHLVHKGLAIAIIVFGTVMISHVG